MILHRLSRRGHSILIVCLLGASVSNVAAAQTLGTSQLGGWVYIDRNNDGVLAFANDPNPEFVIGDVLVSLYSKVANVETFLTSMQTDPYGRYFFANLNPGTYVLRQTQPVEFVDGLDTLGNFQSLINQPIPGSASVGTMSNDVFSDIVLPADVRGDFYNFGERGLAPGYVSKRYLLASTPPMNNAVPEPASLMLALAATAAGWQLRRRKKIH